MWSMLARAIIRAYPRPWRERYASELLDLVESGPPAFGDIVDLVRGCACEWRHDSALQEAVALIAATTHLLVLMDRFAPRPWFPHPGRITAAS